MSKKFNILLLNGPNLNMLGAREPKHYGSLSLSAIEENVGKLAEQHGVNLECFQAINPAAYTHTSVALRDALLAVSIPFVEIHLSNVHKREPFRHHSYFSDVAEGVICGLGAKGYEFALQFALDFLNKKA